MKFETTDIPAVITREPKPNPYTPAVDAIVERMGAKKAVTFAPVDPEHTPEHITRKLRSAAPDHVTIRVKWDDQAKTMTAWAVDKIKKTRGKKD